MLLVRPRLAVTTRWLRHALDLRTLRTPGVTRLEEIDAELDLLAKMLCCAEDVDCSCGKPIRELMHTLKAERDDIPRQRRG